jgi:hypothetical protein
MNLTEEAKNAKPIKPLPFYFKWRIQKQEELKGTENMIQKVKDMWKDIPQD